MNLLIPLSTTGGIWKQILVFERRQTLQLQMMYVLRNWLNLDLTQGQDRIKRPLTGFSSAQAVWSAIL